MFHTKAEEKPPPPAAAVVVVEEQGPFSFLTSLALSFVVCGCTLVKMMMMRRINPSDNQIFTVEVVSN